jgi:sortase A
VQRRTAAAIVLLAAGFALTAYAGSSYARGWLAQERARTEWDARIARAAVERGRASSRETGFPQEPAIGTPVARLVIPKISLDDIVFEGVTDAALNGGPGHLPGSVSPGQPGNSVLSAHRDRHFRNLGEINIGDTITTYTEQNTTSWRVSARKVVISGAPALRRESEPVLTLTTCWPIGYLGGAPERLILKAVPITHETPPGARAFTAADSP